MSDEWKVLSDRVDDLEQQLIRLRRLHSANRKRNQATRLMLYAIGAAAAAALTGLSYQAEVGLAYSFNSVAIESLLGLLGVGGAAAGGIALARDRSAERETVEIEEGEI